MFPISAEFTKHARKRCKERGIDMMRIRRTLLSIPYDEANNPRRLEVRDSNIFVVFEDRNNKRIIVTVSFRQLKRGRP